MSITRECGNRWCLNLPDRIHLTSIDGHEVVLYYCAMHGCNQCQLYFP
jgi:hypothetical protein